MENKFEESAVKYSGDATKSYDIKTFLDKERFVNWLEMYLIERFLLVDFFKGSLLSICCVVLVGAIQEC